MTAVAELQLSRLKRLSWSHPEWWSLCLCVAAWALLLWRAYPAAGLHADAAHAHHGMGGGRAGLAVEAFWWLVMIAAMMFPLILDCVRATAARSLWRRRHRAIGGFLTGYFGPWVAFGLAASAALAALRAHSPPRPALAAAGFVAALLWQVTAVKRRALSACHRTLPLAPDGWRANRDCLRYGWMVGKSCLVSCWALMLACTLAEHSVPAMIGATGIGWAERNAARPNQFLLCACIATLALSYAVAPYV